MEEIMRHSHVTSEYLPAVLFIIVFGWMFFGTTEITTSFSEFGKTYHGFNGFFCAGWAGICK